MTTRTPVPALRVEGRSGQTGRAEVS